MNTKTLIIGMFILIGIAFVASEYGIFQELSVVSSPDSPELVYQTYAFNNFGALNAYCIADAYNVRAKDSKFDAELVSENNFIYLKASNIITQYYDYTKGKVNYKDADLLPAIPHYARYISLDFFINDVQVHPTGEVDYKKLLLPGGNIFTIERCKLGVEETWDGIKCIGYCEPEKSVCVGNVLQTCNAEGTEILKTYCEFGCENNACTMPETFFGFTLQTADSYIYGQDALVQASIIVNDMPYSGNLVNGKIIKDTGVISEAMAYTDDNGVADLIFKNVEGIGDASITATTVYLGEIKTVTKDIYFGGEAIIFIPTTYSYFQYTTKDVEFTVEIKDAKGRYITPATADLTVISTMTNANVISSTSEYIGDGKYRILSDVSGSGLYNGKVNLLYQGVNFESIGIQIDVRDVTLEIDTSGITPMATLGDTETIRFTTTSSIGGEVDPDSITIEISYPSGYVTDTLTKSDLTRVSAGAYEFDYTFTEVEKFTFNIFADKEDYTRGTARASVSVAPVVEEAFNPLVFLLTNISWIIGAVLLIIGIIVYRRLKK